MIFNGERINNIKEAKDVVAAYLFDRAFRYSHTYKTKNGTRHDVEMYRDNIIIPIELKARKNTSWNDYKIEKGKVDYLNTLDNSMIAVVCLDKNVIYGITTKRAISKGFKVENDKFPYDNDDKRNEFKFCDGWHVKWDDFNLIQPIDCSKYNDMINKANSMIGKTDKEIVNELKRIFVS